jgi:hypothetical protein
VGHISALSLTNYYDYHYYCIYINKEGTESVRLELGKGW